MTLLMLMILFCFTGLLLNHNDWLGKQHTDQTLNLPLPEDIRNNLSHSADAIFLDPPLKAITDLLRNKHNLHKIRDINFDEDAGEIIFDFQLPGGYASATLDVSQKQLTMDYRISSWMVVMNDLHKGRHTGPAWSWIIDISAVGMLIFSLAGLIILMQTKKYRLAGILYGIAGLITPSLVYWLWVPRLTGL